MTQVRMTKVRSNLSLQMSRPGGRSMRSAIAQADIALEAHRDGAMDSVRHSLSELETICAAQAPDSQPRVYEAAAALLDLAGFFNTGPLYAAAYSLCDVSDRMSPDAWDWQAIAVHLRAMRLLIADDCRDSEMAKTMLEGLRAVTQRKARLGS